MANIMANWLIPLKVRASMFYNNTGTRSLREASIVGVTYVPGRQLELIVACGEGRFYDSPLEFSGERGGGQYTKVSSHELPTISMEPHPRRVKALRLPFSAAEFGYCHGAITWDRANLTLLIVILDTGEAFFWPPHKVLFGETPQIVPAWLKRRYEDQATPLALTRTYEIDDKTMQARMDVAKAALQGDLEGWRSHGIGLIQRYVPGPKDLRQFRVHIWAPDHAPIGLEGGIHNHRYDFDSVIVCGVLTQEEWTLSPDIEGMWRLWRHDNDTMTVTDTGENFAASPRTLDIHSGQGYAMPRHAYHRSVAKSQVVVTVLERHSVNGHSYALIPQGRVPVNGQTMQLPVKELVERARKHMGVRVA